MVSKSNSNDCCPRCGADVMPDKAELAGVTYTDYYYCGLRVGDDGSIDDFYASECYKAQLKKEREKLAQVKDSATSIYNIAQDSQDYNWFDCMNHIITIARSLIIGEIICM